MKKFITMASVFCLLFALLTACGGNSLDLTEDGGDPNKLIDLTSMGETLLKAQIEKIYNESDIYTGRRVRTNGTYMSYADESGENAEAIIAYSDAACCTMGFELYWSGAPKYIGGQPKPDDIIEVTGVYSMYQDASSGYTYPVLTIDEMIVL
ncbi:MAG: hypothetical protein FWG82_02685 [Oscillospiraceae bacterium]|nr:hypothetical protein [Oscillospiraceae bacterium]